MVSVRNRYYTPEQYLTLERVALYKNEYINGEIVAMSGATEPHNLITINVASLLHTQFKGRACKIYSNDMRVKVSGTGMYTYPDVVAVCGEARFEDERRDTLLNPMVLFEVLSPSTEAYDRGDKFAHYRRLVSLSDYVMISQDRRNIEHYTRGTDDEWTLKEFNDAQSVLTLASVDCRLTLADVYDKVEIKDVEIKELK